METIERILEAIVASAPSDRSPMQHRALAPAIEVALTLITGPPN